MRQLILARALAGIGAGGVIVIGPVIANDIIPLRMRGTYQGYINAAVGLGAISGAGLGGVLCDVVGWRWGFGIQVPLIVAVFVSAYINTPAALRAPFARRSKLTMWEQVKELDVAGGIALSAAVGCVIMALDLARRGAPSTVLAVLLTGTAGAVWLLIMAEKTARHPLMPLGMVTRRPRANLLLSNLLAYMANSAILFNAPFLFQILKLRSSSDSGTLLMLPNIAVTITGVCSGFLMTASGNTKPQMIAGASLVVLGSAVLFFTDHSVSTLVMASFLIPAAAGMGLNTPAVSVAVLATTCRDDQAVMTTTLALWNLRRAARGPGRCHRSVAPER